VIVRNLQTAKDSARRVVSDTWESTRLLLKNDGMGFSFHITTIYAGTRTEMCYRNHFESVYCIAGQGEIENSNTGERHKIEPGVMYALDRHDPHVLHAHTELTLACVFNPPLNGKEVHDKSGAYPLQAESVEA